MKFVNLKNRLASRLKGMNAAIYLPAYITVAILLTMTIGVFSAIKGWETQRFISDFNNHANHMTDAFETNLSSHMEILNSVDQFYRSSTEVTRNDFSSFVSPFFTQYSGIESLGWVPRTADYSRIVLETRAQFSGFPDFQFTEVRKDGVIIRASDRSEYYPVYYIEPSEGSELFLGFDIASDPALLRYLNQAVDTGETTATSFVPLLQESGTESGIFVFAPVFDADSDTSTAEGRSQGLQGFVLGIFDIDGIVSAFLEQGLYRNMELKLYDAAAPSGEQLLFSSNGDTNGEENLAPAVLREDDSREGARYISTLDVAGRQWLLIASPTEEYLSSDNPWYPWVSLSTGLIVTFIVGYILIARVRQSLNIERLAGELSESNRELNEEVMQRRLTEAELRASENKYSQLVEQANDGIRIIQDDEIVFTNSKMREMTGFTIEDYKGRPYYDFVSPGYRKMIQERHRKRLAGEDTPDRYEMEILSKDGRTIPVEVNASIIEFNGRSAAMAIIRDITRRKLAEETLAREATRHRILIEGSRDGIVVLDQDGKVYEANRKFAEMLGYSPEEVTGLSVWDWEYQHPPEVTLEMIRSVGEEGDHFETVHRRKDGSFIDVEISTNAATFGSQKLIFCVCRDITERKREERLEQGENNILTLLGQDAELQEILDAIVNLVEEFEPYAKGSVLKYEPVAHMLFPVSTPNLPDAFKNILKNGLPVDVNTGSCCMAARLKERVVIPDIAENPGAGDNDELMKIASDSGVISCWSQPILSSNGGLLGVITDYSAKKGDPDERAVQVLEWSARIAAIAIEHKMAEESLKLSEETFSMVFYANPMPMIISLDDNRIISDINMAFENFSGFSREECIGKPIDDLHMLQDEKEEQEIQKAIERDGRVINQEVTMRIKSGEIRNVLISSEPVTLDGKLHYIITHRDITLQKRIAKEREETEQKAYLSSRLAAVGQMAAGVAHEINNPLTGVLGFTDLLIARKDLPDDIRKDLEIVNEGAQRVSKIVRGMLTFSRNDNSERSPVDINEVIRTTLSLRSYKMITDSIQIRLSLDNTLPLTIASGGQLQQVFLNLIINAEQAIKQAGVKGKLTISTEHDSGIIRVSFKDNGSGISRQDIGKVFEPFFTTKEPGEGTGLGLSLCYGIVREHGGQMYVKSTKGKGATFVIELPVADVGSLQLVHPESGSGRKPGSKYKILVVDDEPVIRSYMERFLRREGHDVELVDNAEAALDKIPGSHFDVILMDIKMPVMNGIELYRKIRKMNGALSRRIIFITGDVLAADTRAFFSKYKPAYISKPIDKDRLRKELSQIMER